MKYTPQAFSLLTLIQIVFRLIWVTLNASTKATSSVSVVLYIIGASTELEPAVPAAPSFLLLHLNNEWFL